MPNAPAISRPDVEGIAARVAELLTGKGSIRELACEDIPALIAHIEALEVVVKAARVMSKSESWNFLLKANQGGNDLLNSLAALGESDG